MQSYTLLGPKTVKEQLVFAISPDGEYVAEGGITRLTAIYQNAPKVIGPMRSSRFISLKIARHYKGLLFQSGESQATADRASGDTSQFLILR